MHINFRNYARPFTLTAAHKIPYGWKNKVKEHLDWTILKQSPSACRNRLNGATVVIPNNNSDDIRVCVNPDEV